MSRITAVFALAVVAICATGCNKAADDKLGITHTTAAELDPANPSNLLPSPSPEPTTNDYASTVRREQIELKARIDDEMGAIDHQVADLRRGGKIDSPEARALLVRRRQLAADDDVVATADERGWDELKATVESDLSE